jgi:hypothetical protein
MLSLPIILKIMLVHALFIVRHLLKWSKLTL